MGTTDAPGPERLSTLEVSTTPAIAILQRKRRPIRAPTILFLVLVCMMLVAGSAWSSWNSRHVRLIEAEIETQNMARALAEHAENTIKVVDTVLVGMVERVETDGVSNASAQRLHELMIRHLAELSVLQNLFVCDENGRGIVNTGTDTSKQRNSSDREYFQYHKTHTDRGPHIGAPIIGRTSAVWVVPVSRRLEHADGSFAGVALATINIDSFRKIYEGFDVGRAGAIFIALDNGIMLLRVPFAAANIGLDISKGSVFGLFKSMGPAGTAVRRSGIDNIERIYSFRLVATYPLLVSVARSKQELLADWQSRTVSLGLGLALLIGGLVTLGVRLVRQIDIRDRLESELRDAKSALENSNASLTSLAFNDGLTGLSNRRYLEKALSREFRAARRSGLPLAMVMIDVDCFKKYNDLYGHPAGDKCLRAIGQAIQSGLRRPSDVAARYGGEEFAVLLPATDLTGALAVAETIRAAVQNKMLEHRDNPFGIVTISAGAYALIPGTTDSDPAELVREADRALYLAKANGRNRVGVA